MSIASTSKKYKYSVSVHIMQGRCSEMKQRKRRFTNLKCVWRPGNETQQSGTAGSL